MNIVGILCVLSTLSRVAMASEGEKNSVRPPGSLKGTIAVTFKPTDTETAHCSSVANKYQIC